MNIKGDDKVLEQDHLRCAHISDLHFSDLTWKFSHLLSKKWVGYFNLLFKRRKEYSTDHLTTWIDLLKTKKVSHVFISGDLTCITSKEELSRALDFVTSLKAAGFTVFVLPGNHDKYTKTVCKNKDFYQHFEKFFPSDFPYTLSRDGVAARRLNDTWWLVGLDTAVPTSLISSCGFFSTSQEDKLKELLNQIPKKDSILLLNHYPFFQNESPRKILKRGKALQNILSSHPNIRLYLHGHTHRHVIADLRASQLPIILDSGSITHERKSSWNLIDLKKEGCEVWPFFQGPAPGEWEAKPVASYTFTGRSS